MRIFKAPFWAAALVIFSGPALAQEMYPGQSVTVNPEAAGGRPLLYPGGTYMRLQKPLLQPYQRQEQAPIQLHMPGSRPVVRATAVAKPKAEAPVAKAAPQPQPESVAEAKPVAPKPAPAPKPQPAPTKQIAKTESSPARSATPAAVDEMAGWNKTGLIEFLPDQGEVADGRMDAVRFLAGSLNSTLSASPSSRVQILAYGGTRGDKGSDARRLSLRRALSVRQILIDSGVSRDQIDVRAMGGADDGGPADRVDVYVRS